ncbi:MAG: hypothetical protein HQK84_07495 [Nitrospinae bacterium]|nr:hypothetical protein [Nitrospinota bacterium]
MGKKRDEEVTALDKKINGGDGSHSGKVRWYDCSGIDWKEQSEQHTSS